jgi:sulfatase maturation enzyme AslB (radical SAM superfamily)
VHASPILQVHPSLRCDLACAHCYSVSGPHARDEVPLRTLVRAVEDAADEGYTRLAVSGGEPLMYEHLASLLASGRRAGMQTSLVTNGMLVHHRQRWDPIVPLLDAVAISIDGTRAEHDSIRGRAGAFDRTVENLAIVRESGVPFALIVTLTRYNVGSLESVVRLAAEAGATGVQVHPLSLVGRASVELADHRPDELELMTAIVESQWLGDELGIPVELDAADRVRLARYRHDIVPESAEVSLGELCPVLVVAADGSVRPLTWGIDPSIWLGSLHDAHLADLVESWRETDAPARLVDACKRTWLDLTAPGGPAAAYWLDEVSERVAAGA